MKIHALIALVNAHRAKFRCTYAIAIHAVCVDLRIAEADRATLERLYCVKRGVY